MNDIRALATLAQAYFDAAYEMHAETFASLFHPASSVTSVGDGVSVTPIDAWLNVVRNAKSPKSQGLERRDELLSVAVMGSLALVTLKLQMPPRYFTDLLSCARIDGTWKIVQKVTRLETR
ncbi:MAG: hypothetical protein HOV81_00505 [Kofleriaceae bacterium]|nr:hypothetical protein [Kofleriaceae bacterium]